MVLATVLNDKFERKFSVALVNILAGVVIVGWFFSSGLTFLLLGFAEMFLQGFKFPVMYTYTSEIFGTKIRTLGYGIADGLGHLGGAVGPILFASTYMSNQLSSFLMLSGVTALAGVIVLAWGVKTTGKPLEQIRG